MSSYCYPRSRRDSRPRWYGHRGRWDDRHDSWDDYHGKDFCDYPEREPLLVLESSVPRNHQKNVSPFIKSIKLVLRRGWGWSSCVDIDMWEGSKKMPIRIRESLDKCSGSRTIRVIPVKPLRGGVLYKVRIRKTYVDHCGNRVKESKMISFTTACRS